MQLPSDDMGASPTERAQDLVDDEYRVAVIVTAIDMHRRSRPPDPMAYRPAPEAPASMAQAHWDCLWDVAWDAVRRIAAWPPNEQKEHRWPSIQAAVQAAVSDGRLPHVHAKDSPPG